MDEQLWQNALDVAARTGVPAPVLVAAYVRAVQEQGTYALSREAVQQAAEQLVAAVGVLAVLSDADLAELAERNHLSVDQVRAIVSTPGDRRSLA